MAACGSSTTESAITPDRFIAFGDAYSDVGQKGSRYTVNNGTVNNWTLQVADRYGKTLTSASAGGLSYAQGNARLAATPDAAGDASTPTIAAQVDAFLAKAKDEELSANAQFTIDTGISVFFADPHSPWQRATNENTNGLLRQYFPKGTDLSQHGTEQLSAVAHALNTRPRKTLAWKTPAEALDRLLKQDMMVGVATTG